MQVQQLPHSKWAARLADLRAAQQTFGTLQHFGDVIFEPLASAALAALRAVNTCNHDRTR